MYSFQRFKDLQSLQKYNNIWMFPKVDGIFYLPQYLECKIKPEVFISKENLQQFNSTVDKLIDYVQSLNMNALFDTELLFRMSALDFFHSLIDETFNIINDCISYSFNKTYINYLNDEKTIIGDIIFNFTPKYNVRIYFNHDLAERKLKDYFFVKYNKNY